MRTLTLFCFCFLSSYLIAQVCHRAYWVDAYDGSQAQEFFLDVDRHPDGGFVVLGKHGTDGTTFGTQSINTGAQGYFLAKMDSAGNFSQLVSVLPQGGIALKRIAVSPDGSVVAGCTVNSNITLSSETFHIHGGAKPLLVKFDAQFNYLWHRAAENTSNTSEVRDISCDSNGNIYWGGIFSGTYLSFGGDFSLHRATQGGGWLSKIDSDGQFQWIRGIAPGVSAGLQTITADSNDEVWITGQATIGVNGSLKFSDQIIAPGYLTNSWCTYVGKYDTDGTCIWGKISSNSSTFGSFYTTDAMADDQGNMFICGQLNGTFEWYGMPMLGGDGSGFLWSLDTDGNGRWFKTMGGQGSSESAAALDVRGDRIAVVGSLSSNQPYVGNFPVYSLSTGTYKTFNAQFYSNGQLEFCRMNQNDTQNFLQQDVVIDEGLNQIVFGYFKGANVPWYPLTLTHNGTNPKMFVAKYGTSSITTFSISAGPDKLTTCGTNVQLNGSTTPTNGVGFGWWPDLGFSNNYAKTPGVNTTLPTDYIFYGFYQGCVKQDTVHVDLSNYALTIAASENTSHCIGDTSALWAVCNDPAAIIAWTPNYRLTSATALTTNSFTNTSLNYVVEATLNGCKARDTVYVQVHRKPSIDIPYQQFYNSYQMHTCAGAPIEADLGVPENTYTISPPANITWQNDHSVTFGADQMYYDGYITAVSPEGCENEIIFSVNAYDYQIPPPILNQPQDTIYLCPATGFVYEEEFMISADIPYLPEEFNFSWYSGWQVDSLDGLGWRDIEIWNHGHYELFPNSIGFPTSAYYVPLNFWNVEPGMDGFKYRAYIHDICSPRVYTEQLVLRVGPAFTDQTPALTICEGATDTLFVDAANSNNVFQWQVFRNNEWTDLLVDENHIIMNGSELIIANAEAGMDSLFRCQITGCAPQIFSYSQPIPITVQQNNFSVSGPYQTSTCLGETMAIHVITNGGNFNAQWFRDGQSLAANSIGHAGVTNDTLWIQTNLFNPDEHQYSCQLFNTQCGQNFTSEAITVQLLLPENIEWQLPSNNLCHTDDSIWIGSAEPIGGTYSGSILSGEMIDPSEVSPGTYSITYTYTDPTTACVSEALQSVSIWGLPNVSLELSANQICLNSATSNIEVAASPAGGTFTSLELEILENEEAIAIPDIPGTYSLMYSYTNANGCSSEVDATLEVLDTIALSWVNHVGTFCENSTTGSIELPNPQGGLFSPYSVSANTIAIDALNEGDYTLEYTYAHSNGCVSKLSSLFTIQSINIVWTDSLLSACVSSDPIPLGDPTPLGGNFTGPGVIQNLFDPTSVGTGFYPVTYSYVDGLTGCAASATQFVQVYGQPPVQFTMNDHDFCENEAPYQLNEGIPIGGTYTGASVFQTSNDSYALQTSDLIAGNYEVTYTYTDDSGCVSSLTDEFTIHSQLAIDWVDNLGSFCANVLTADVVAPNPSGGSFFPDYVSAESLDLSGLGTGTYNVDYTYIDEFGCSAMDQSVFTIQDTIPVIWLAMNPLLPNNGFHFCGNLEENTQANLSSWTSPSGGVFYQLDDLLEDNIWNWGPFFEPGLYDMTYQLTDSLTGCTSQGIQTFQLDVCGQVSEGNLMNPHCWSDGRSQLQFHSIETGSFEVIDMAGKMVHFGLLNGGLQTEPILLSAGVYSIRMSAGAKWFTEKVVIGL